MGRIILKSFVLDSRYIFEIDREVILLTKERGKLKTIGKGGAKVPNRFGSSIIPFSFVEATIWESWKGGLTLESTELIRPSFSMLSDIRIYPFISPLQEILMLVLPENLPREKTYRLVKLSLPIFRKNPVSLAFYGIFWALKLEGFPVEREISAHLKNDLRKSPDRFSSIEISPSILISLLEKTQSILSQNINSLFYLKTLFNIPEQRR